MAFLAGALGGAAGGAAAGGAAAGAGAGSTLASTAAGALAAGTSGASGDAGGGSQHNPPPPAFNLGELISEKIGGAFTGQTPALSANDFGLTPVLQKLLGERLGESVAQRKFELTSPQGGMLQAPPVDQQRRFMGSEFLSDFLPF